MSRRRRRGNTPRIILIAVIVLLGLGLLFMGARWLEEREKKPEIMEDYRQRYTYGNIIEVGGVSYRQRKELTTVLLMGVDRDSDQEISGFRSGGQADFMRLIVLDPRNNRISQLAIDRDTMTPITVLGVLGDVATTRTMQICLSHSYGDGKEQSCEYSVEAVSNLLLGTRIDHYAAMNLDGIAEVNDWVGGVTVTLEDDFSGHDPAMTPGTTLTLMGDQAETFVRSRMDVSDGTNVSRMARQQQYLSELGDKIHQRAHEDKQSVGELYDLLLPYLTTDLARGRLINEAWTARDYEMAAIIELPGTHKIGDSGHMEFRVDENALQQTVLDLFYEKVK